MADTFDTLGYLKQRIEEPNNQRVTYVLEQLHRVIGDYTTKKCGSQLKVLDFGSGPVVQNSISAAAFASEIVFSDISYANREAVQKWLDGDADAFNWSPHFDYVVKTLEGKGEKEARKREQRLRKISKVVFCDALSETPMEKGYEGPYDIILLCTCLEGVCSDIKTFTSCMKTVVALLKPGGLLFDFSTNSACDTPGSKYTVGDGVYNCVHLTHSTVVSVMRECGLSDVDVNFAPLNPQCKVGYLSYTPRGFHAITGVKPES